MKRTLAIAALPLLLGGCLPVLPPAIQLAVTGFSGVALLTTGKSTTDHVLSAAVDEDCALMRLAWGDAPCRDYKAGEKRPQTEIVAWYPGDRDGGDRPIPEKPVRGGESILTAEAPSAAAPDDRAGIVERLMPAAPATVDVPGFVRMRPDKRIEPLQVKPASVTANGPSSRSAGLSPWAPAADAETATGTDSERMTVLPLPRPDRSAKVSAEAADHYVMLGSFRSEDEANALKRQYVERRIQGDGPAAVPVIMPVVLKGGLWHRVAIGPFSGRQATAIAETSDPLQGKKAWAAKVAGSGS